MKRTQRPDEVKRLTKNSKREDYVEVLTYWQAQLEQCEQGTTRRNQVLGNIRKVKARLADYDKEHATAPVMNLQEMLDIELETRGETAIAAFLREQLG